MTLNIIYCIILPKEYLGGIRMKCPHCSAEIENTKFCEYCGSQITAEMRKEQEQLNKKGCPKCGSSNVTFRRENQGEVNGKKTKQIVHRTVGVCKDCGETWFTDSEVKKRKTWLWVLGWIFIFPLPLTILLLRRKEMNQHLKYGIIAAAWIIYAVLMITGGGKDSKPAVDEPAQTTGFWEQITEAAGADPAQQETEAKTTDSAKPVTETTEKKTEKATKAAKKLTGIRPEFKKAMDDYEAFFDEYIDFMETYSKSDNPVAMMAEYAEYMTKYSQAMQSMSEMGEEEMSTEESAYYLKVTTRINTKLAQSAAIQ